MKAFGFDNVVRLFVMTFVVMTISACSDNKPTSDNDDPTKALPFVASYKAVSVNQSATRVEGAWTAPIKLATETFDVSTDVVIAGPDLALDAAGGLLSSWSTYSGIDEQSNRSQTTQNTLLQSSSIGSSWTNVLQNPASNHVSITRLDESSGDIYTLWQDLGQMKLSQYQSSQWLAAKDLGAGQFGEIAFSNGDVIVVTVNQNIFSASFISRGIKLPAIGLQRNIGVRVNQLSLSLDANKNAVVVWSEVNNSQMSLWSAEYSTVGGWNNVKTIPLNNVSTSTDLQNITLVTDENTVNRSSELFFSQQDANQLSLYSVSYSNGTWSALNNLASTTSDGPNQLDVSSNGRGDMVVVWREQQLIDGQKYNQLKSRRFNPSIGWSLAIPVTQSIQSFVGNTGLMNLSRPEISLDNIGGMSASWVEDGQGRSDLLVNHYNNVSGGWETPELVVSYDNTISSIESTSIILDHKNKSIVAWQEKIKNSLQNQINFWSSFEAGDGVIVEQPLQILTTQVAEVITPSAVWDVPVDIWNDSIFSNVASRVHGPHLEVSDTGTGFISLYKNIDFDPLTGGYLRQESIVLNNSAPGVWTADQPFPSTTGVLGDEVEIKIAANGDAFALWLVDGSLYFNHYTVGVGWGAETNLGFSGERYDLLFDLVGNVWIFWVMDGGMTLQQYIPGTGLQAVILNSVPNAWYFATPVFDANGAINISWITLPGLGSQPFSNTNDLNLIKFEPGVGWGFVEIAPPLNSFNPMSTDLKLFSTINDEVMAISQDTHGNIFAITFSAAVGWGRWENLDYNLDKSDHVAHTSAIFSNGENNIMVVWSERTLDVDGSRIYRIYSNRYDAAGDANGIHWPVPERVGAIIPQFDATTGQQLEQFQTLPRIGLLADGRAIATWLDSSEINSAMYANQFTPGAGWGATPDQVISYDRLTTGIVKSPDVALLSNGKVLLSWRQEISTEFANEIHVWVTEGQF